MGHNRNSLSLFHNIWVSAGNYSAARVWNHLEMTSLTGLVQLSRTCYIICGVQLKWKCRKPSGLGSHLVGPLPRPQTYWRAFSQWTHRGAGRVVPGEDTEALHFHSQTWAYTPLPSGYSPVSFIIAFDNKQVKISGIFLLVLWVTLVN